MERRREREGNEGESERMNFGGVLIWKINVVISRRKELIDRKIFKIFKKY